MPHSISLHLISLSFTQPEKAQWTASSFLPFPYRAAAVNRLCHGQRFHLVLPKSKPLFLRLYGLVLHNDCRRKNFNLGFLAGLSFDKPTSVNNSSRLTCTILSKTHTNLRLRQFRQKLEQSQTWSSPVLI